MSGDKTVRTDHLTPDKPLPAATTYRYTKEDQARMSNREGTIVMRVQVGQPNIVVDESRSGNWLDK